MCQPIWHLGHTSNRPDPGGHTQARPMQHPHDPHMCGHGLKGYFSSSFSRSTIDQVHFRAVSHGLCKVSHGLNFYSRFMVILGTTEDEIIDVEH